MSETLPRLRTALEFLPSPVPERPGVVVRDPFRYCEDLVLIPAGWVPALSCLDGRHTDLDVQAMLVRQRGGELVPSREVREFVSALRSRGLLETEEFFGLRQRRHAEFRAAHERFPVHSGAAYPDEARRLREVFDSRFSAATEPSTPKCSLVGVAAPHVSPDGGWDCYRAAYQRIDSSLVEKTFVILGTSHYGDPDTFGLTRKTYVTPLGSAETDGASVDFLLERASAAVEMEDYCHAVEHSIEFQVVFLQYRLGAPVRIVPILCGPFVQCLEGGGLPESNGPLREFFDALAELADMSGENLFWILGIDLAHIGRRYGDPFAVTAGEGPMVEVGEQDRQRLERVCEWDLSGFHHLVHPAEDRLKWCGFSPLYTFLASLGRVRDVRGRVLAYQQWSIDPESVVTFAGLEFFHSSVVNPPSPSATARRDPPSTLTTDG